MIARSVPEISPGVGLCDEEDGRGRGGIGYSSRWNPLHFATLHYPSLPCPDFIIGAELGRVAAAVSNCCQQSNLDS